MLFFSSHIFKNTSDNLHTGFLLMFSSTDYLVGNLLRVFFEKSLVSAWIEPWTAINTGQNLNHYTTA